MNIELKPTQLGIEIINKQVYNVDKSIDMFNKLIKENKAKKANKYIKEYLAKLDHELERYLKIKDHLSICVDILSSNSQ